MSSVRHTARFEVHQPVQTVFPLFSPEGETLWVPGWTYENVMGTDELKEDYVFLTDRHDHASGPAIWMVKRYQPDVWRIELYKVEPNDKVGLVIVQCAASSNSSTSVEVTYEYCGISSKGNEFVESFDKEAYDEFIGEWKSLLSAYFESSNK